MSAASTARWLLLIHRLPPKPDYVRVKVRRRLRRIGAEPIKDSVYVLPNNEESLEDFLWLAQEIRADGGEAIVAEASFIAGTTDHLVAALFGDSLHGTHEGATHEGAIGTGRVWVTRVGVGVDRIASAWLIRRFIDPEATFRFVPSRGYHSAAHEIRFDMFEAEYTHEGDRCTFEVLLERFGLRRDRALRSIAGIVHDIDCKDARFGHAETAGIAALIRSLSATCVDDADRLDRGGAIFTDLYNAFASSRKRK